MYCEFISSLSEILPVEDQTRMLFQQRLKIVKVPKGRVLLSDGEMCDKLWYLQSGLVRGYHLIADGHGNFRDVTNWFAKERDFLRHKLQKQSGLPVALSRQATETCIGIFGHRNLRFGNR